MMMPMKVVDAEADVEQVDAEVVVMKVMNLALLVVLEVVIKSVSIYFVKGNYLQKIHMNAILKG